MVNLFLYPQFNLIFILAITLFLGFLIQTLLKTIGAQLARYSAKTKFLWDDYLSIVLKSIRWWWVTPVLFETLTKHLLTLTWHSSEKIKPLIIILTVIQSILVVNRTLKLWRESTLNDRIERDPSTVAAVGLISRIVQFVVLSILILVGLDNLGVDVKALVAGLGIGGIAIALAAQNVLGDLLASLSIVFDKPFVVGDYIVVGNEKGTIEYIGIKSTRLRSLSGEELIFSNKDLLDSRVRNFKRMAKRRLVQRFGVLYSTPPSLLRQIPSEVEALFLSNPLVQFERCHFVQLGESSLDFELIFFVLDPDFQKASLLQQEYLFLILEKFQKMNIDFAFPTRTIHVFNTEKATGL